MAEKKYSSSVTEALRKQKQEALTRDLTGYAALIGDSFAARLNILAKVIGDVHHPSLGNYKERLLASTIRDHIPSGFRVGTGFVLFPKERPPGAQAAPGYDELNQSDFEVSGQCDILVYDAATFPTVFRDGDFVVLRPESVCAVIEVKGALNNVEIDSTAEHFLDFGRKWRRCQRFYGARSQRIPTNPTFALMGWRVAPDAKGRPKTDGTRLRGRIAQFCKKHVLKSDLPGLPLIENAYIYDDSMVICTSFSDDGDPPSLSVGWMTLPGRFTRFDAARLPRFEGDRTVASLLAAVHASIDPGLKRSYNRFFSHLDETRADLLEFEHGGYTAWLDHPDDINALWSDPASSD
jgi:hypothetical protein